MDSSNSADGGADDAHPLLALKVRVQYVSKPREEYRLPPRRAMEDKTSYAVVGVDDVHPLLSRA